GLGFRVGVESTAVVPIVPTAAIFDLGRGGDFSRYPDAALGRAAVDAALSDRDGPFQGSVGAGIGAVTGEMRGGVGTASAVLPGGTVVG
ncbi:P1 family peptidase, partial [Rhizobium johnstonii]